MDPRAAFARVQPVGNLDLALRILETSREVSGMNAIFAQELIARSLCKQNVVLLTKLDRASGPAIRLIVKPVMLITARGVRIDLRDHRRCKSADHTAVRCRRNE